MAKSRGGRDLVKPYGPSAIKLPNKDFQVLMENAEPIFLNFEGRPGPFNEAGQRSFCVLLDPEVAQDMRADGWNIKQSKEYEGEEGDYYVQVNCKFRDRYGNELRPPKLQILTSRGATRLTEDQAYMLDKVDIAKVDLIFNGKVRQEDGQQKIVAYLQSYFCHINEDYLEQKYAEMSEAELMPMDDAQTPPALEDPNVIDGEVVSDTMDD